MRHLVNVDYSYDLHSNSSIISEFSVRTKEEGDNLKYTKQKASKIQDFAIKNKKKIIDFRQKMSKYFVFLDFNIEKPNFAKKNSIVRPMKSDDKVVKTQKNKNSEL